MLMCNTKLSYFLLYSLRLLRPT